VRARLRADIEKGARVVAKTRWFRQPLLRRIPNWIGYGLARFMIGIFRLRRAVLTPAVLTSQLRRG